MATTKLTNSSRFKEKLLVGDVLKVFARLPASLRFDLIIADPPYNIGKDFGNNHDKLPLEDYLAWTQAWLTRCLERLSAEGLVYVYGFPEILARISALYPIAEQRWLVWHYTNKAVPRAAFWQRSHESILCLWRPGRPQPALEIDQIREPYSKSFLSGSAGKVRPGTPSRFGQGRKTRYQAHERGALPRDVIKVPALAGGAGAAERWFMCRTCGDEVFAPQAIKHHRTHDILKHETQKPMALTRRLINSRVNGQGGRVFIPFAGSGSECVVAESLGLDWLGVEINPNYVEFATKWLQKSIR